MTDLIDPGAGCVWVQAMGDTACTLVPLAQLSLDFEEPDVWYCRWHGEWERISADDASRLASLMVAYWDRQAGGRATNRPTPGPLRADPANRWPLPQG